MDLYLHTGGRQKGEWFPGAIAGLTRCSKTEITDDLEFITAGMPANEHASSQAQDGDDGDDGDDNMDNNASRQPSSRAPIHQSSSSSSLPSASSSSAAVGGSVAGQKRKTKMERQEAELAAELATSKRARLNHKIQQERDRLQSTKQSGFHLRQSLDQLRAETQQYEDAIAQTKREMEMIQRETQILEDRLQQSRSEYHWGLDQAERIRVEEEKIETILRDKLSHVNTQVNDVSDRVHQLRQLEEEFKLKDVRIQQLETEIMKLQKINRATEVIEYLRHESALAQQQASAGSAPIVAPAASAAASPTAPSSAAAASSSSVTAVAAAAATANGMVTSPSSSSLLSASPSASTLSATPSIIAAVPSDVNASHVALITDAAPSSSSSSAPVPTSAVASAAAPEVVNVAELKVEAAVSMEDVAPKVEVADVAAAAPISVVAVAMSDDATAPAAAPSVAPAAVADVDAAAPSSSSSSASPAAAVDASSSSSSVPSSIPVAAASTAAAPSLSELLCSIHDSTTVNAHLTMSLKLLEEQLESSNRHLIDRDRAMKYMQEQIERFSNLNHELTYKLAQAENGTLLESSKNDQSYRSILFGQKQRDEQDVIISGYEEKLKVFEQLLNVADVRATTAEENVTDLLQEVKTRRMSSQVMQCGYNKMVAEYERCIREKHEALVQLDAVAHRSASSTMTPTGSHVRFASDDTSDAAGGASPSASLMSPRVTSTSTPPRDVHAGHTRYGSGGSGSGDRGFGGINGLASPNDAANDGGQFAYGSSSSSSLTASTSSPYRASLNISSSSSMFSPRLSSSSSLSSSSNYFSAAFADLPSSTPSLTSSNSSYSTSSPSSFSLTSKAVTSPQLNSFLIIQNKDLSARLHVLTQHNTQLQMALIKAIHRPQPSAATKQHSYGATLQLQAANGGGGAAAAGGAGATNAPTLTAATSLHRAQSGGSSVPPSSSSSSSSSSSVAHHAPIPAFSFSSIAPTAVSAQQPMDIDESSSSSSSSLSPTIITPTPVVLSSHSSPSPPASSSSSNHPLSLSISSNSSSSLLSSPSHLPPPHTSPSVSSSVLYSSPRMIRSPSVASSRSSPQFSPLQTPKSPLPPLHPNSAHAQAIRETQMMQL